MHTADQAAICCIRFMTSWPDTSGRLCCNEAKQWQLVSAGRCHNADTCICHAELSVADFLLSLSAIFFFRALREVHGAIKVSLLAEARWQMPVCQQLAAKSLNPCVFACRGRHLRVHWRHNRGAVQPLDSPGRLLPLCKRPLQPRRKLSGMLHSFIPSHIAAALHVCRVAQSHAPGTFLPPWTAGMRLWRDVSKSDCALYCCKQAELHQLQEPNCMRG